MNWPNSIDFPVQKVTVAPCYKGQPFFLPSSSPLYSSHSSLTFHFRLKVAKQSQGNPNELGRWSDPDGRQLANELCQIFRVGCLLEFGKNSHAWKKNFVRKTLINSFLSIKIPLVETSAQWSPKLHPYQTLNDDYILQITKISGNEKKELCWKDDERHDNQLRKWNPTWIPQFPLITIYFRWWVSGGYCATFTYSAIFNDDVVRFEMGTLLKKWSSTARVHSLLSSPRCCKVYRSESGSLHRHTLMHRSRGLRKDPAWDASRESPGTDCSAIYKESPVQE